MVQYELARRRVEVGERLVQHAPRPLLVRGDGGESSPLSMLLLTRMLPQLADNRGAQLEDAREVLRESRRNFDGDGEA
jgi:hypothetical protein